MPQFHLPATKGLAVLAVAAGLALPAAAESFASSASSAGSASVGSLSDSVSGSSDSSRNQQVAQGDYRIVAITPAAQPERLQLTLEPVAAAEGATGFVLTLPEATATAEHLAAGDVVRVQPRPYGLAFARADRGQAFFLALADDWRRELDPQVVTL